MLSFYIYLASVSDDLVGVFSAFSTIGCITLIIFGSIILYCYINIEEDKRNEKKFSLAKKAIKRIFCFTIFFLIGAIFTPSKDQLYAMYIVPKITEIKGIEKLPTNLVSYINNFLEKNKQKKGS